MALIKKNKEYYTQKAEKIRERSRLRTINGKRNKLKEANYTLRRTISIKIAIVIGYGGKCSCCSESRLGCLHLDHINNDGAEQRKSLGITSRRCGGSKFYKWVIDNRFPKTLQLLCANCHALKHCKRKQLHMDAITAFNSFSTINIVELSNAA